MPVYDLRCMACAKDFLDQHGTYESVKGSPCPDCSQPREIKLGALGTLWRCREFQGDASKVQRFEIKVRDTKEVDEERRQRNEDAASDAKRQGLR